jgi:hypothetical protein
MCVFVGVYVWGGRYTCVYVYILVYRPVYGLYMYMYTHMCVCMYVYTHVLEFQRGSTRPIPVENSGLVVRQSTQLINV